MFLVYNMYSLGALLVCALLGVLAGMVIGGVCAAMDEAKRKAALRQDMAEGFEAAANKEGVSEEFRAEMREYAAIIKGEK